MTLTPLMLHIPSPQDDADPTENTEEQTRSASNQTIIPGSPATIVPGSPATIVPNTLTPRLSLPSSPAARSPVAKGVTTPKSPGTPNFQVLSQSRESSSSPSFKDSPARNPGGSPIQFSKTPPGTIPPWERFHVLNSPLTVQRSIQFIPTTPRESEYVETENVVPVMQTPPRKRKNAHKHHGTLSSKKSKSKEEDAIADMCERFENADKTSGDSNEVGDILFEEKPHDADIDNNTETSNTAIISTYGNENFNYTIHGVNNHAGNINNAEKIFYVDKATKKPKRRNSLTVDELIAKFGGKSPDKNENTLWKNNSNDNVCATPSPVKKSNFENVLEENMAFSPGKDSLGLNILRAALTQNAFSSNTPRSPHATSPLHLLDKSIRNEIHENTFLATTFPLADSPINLLDKSMRNDKLENANSKLSNSPCEDEANSPLELLDKQSKTSVVYAKSSKNSVSSPSFSHSYHLPTEKVRIEERVQSTKDSVLDDHLLSEQEDHEVEYICEGEHAISNYSQNTSKTSINRISDRDFSISPKDNVYIEKQRNTSTNSIYIEDKITPPTKPTKRRNAHKHHGTLMRKIAIRNSRIAAELMEDTMSTLIKRRNSRIARETMRKYSAQVELELNEQLNETTKENFQKLCEQLTGGPVN